MTPDDAAQVISEWLDAVHLESASARIAEKRLAAATKDGPCGPLYSASRAELARAAAHEAAHAVVAHKTGLRVTRARVRTDGSGVVMYESPTPADDAMLPVVLTDLAGIAIELLVGADAQRQFQLAHDHDILAARLNADVYRRVELRPSLSNLAFAKLAVAIVAANLNLVARIADALMVCNELDQEAIEAIAGRSH